MVDLIKKLTVPLIFGTIIFFSIIFLSESIFGDLINTDSLKPLLVIIPVFALVAGYLIYHNKKK